MHEEKNATQGVTNFEALIRNLDTYQWGKKVHFLMLYDASDRYGYSKGE